MHYTGQPLKRLEDPRLVTGNGSFVDDLRLPIAYPHVADNVCRLLQAV
jgi:CO/xanthine dehydrogenase Mo-binding subunit